MGGKVRLKTSEYQSRGCKQHAHVAHVRNDPSGECRKERDWHACAEWVV
jgi:hypothetical protein